MLDTFLEKIYEDFHERVLKIFLCSASFQPTQQAEIVHILKLAYYNNILRHIFMLLLVPLWKRKF